MSAEAIKLATGICVEFEGFRAEPYLDPVGIPTIGYGVTRYRDGTRVKLTDPPVTKEQAAEDLQYHLEKLAPTVLRMCPQLADNPNRLGAVLSWTYNLGVGRLSSSTMRVRINAGDWSGAATEMKRWIRAGGKVLNGLVRRRDAEVVLFMKPHQENSVKD